MKVIVLLTILISLTSVHITQESNPKSGNSICHRIIIPNITFMDTLDMNGSYHVIESSVLSNPTDSIFLIYTDSINIYDPENYTEYIMLVKRKVPIQLLK